MPNEENSLLFLSGGFGTKLDASDAQVVGMIPQTEKNIIPIGNAALSGAILMLFSQKFRKKAEELSKCAQNIDLAQKSDFQERYISALSFPDL